MPVVQLPPDLFLPLCEGFAIATDDPDGPAELEAIRRVRRALAAAAHALPGEPFVLQLKPPDLTLLADAFDAGAELLDAISDAQQQDIDALLMQAQARGR